ncbi:MAG TPA: hypothetical protein VII74_03670 [Chthoniobacterales bacterium]
MKRWLSRRKRALIECAPISETPPSDRAMRSALESAHTIPEAAASLTTQQQFDQALAALVRKIEIPKEAAEWFVNASLMKGAKRSWKRTAQHPAILATVLAILVMIGLGIFFFVERLQEFPGSAEAKKLLVVAGQTRVSQFEPMNTDAVNLGDYFFMKDQLEHFDVPMRFADFRATGARVFDDEDGHRVAQVSLAESGVQFFFFAPEKRPRSTEKPGGKIHWNFVEAEGWAGAIEEHNGVCFMIAKRGSKADLRPYLSESGK